MFKNIINIKFFSFFFIVVNNSNAFFDKDKLMDICLDKTTLLTEIQGFNQLGRDQWVLKKSLLVKEGSTVLDVGAGTCLYKKFFNHCNYIAHDFCENKGHVAYGKIDIVSDITEIPLEDNFADVILCTEVFEHIPDPIEALKEIARVLKPGGTLFLTAPLGAGLHQEPFDYYGGYTPYFYKYYFEKFGLKVEEISPNGGFLKHLGQECARFSWNFEEYKNFIPDEFQQDIVWLFSEFLPRFLYGLDEKCLLKEFTVGFHVVGIKK